PLEGLMRLTEADLQRLHGIVGQLGYIVLLASPTGIIVDSRQQPAQAEEFGRWGACLGGVWSEEAEGTNGIGTCIAEQEAVTVRRGQHFRLRHAEFSCSAAPVFDCDGRLAAVLDVTSARPEIADHAHAMALAVARDAARAMEERQFRHRYRKAWIAALTPP